MYVDESIMEEASIHADEIREVEEGASDDESAPEQLPAPAPSAEPLTLRQRLEQELDQAIKVEDYEAAARIRDEISRLQNPT